MEKLKVVSYYDSFSEHFPYWEKGIGLALPKYLGNATCIKIDIPCGEYDILPEKFDINYCGCNYFYGRTIFPKTRPNGFVYSFMTDYEGRKSSIESFIERVRPNLLGCLQVTPEELVEFGAKYDCEVVSIPFFIFENFANEQKTINAFCSGNINPSGYPCRYRLYKYLKTIKEDVCLSCTIPFEMYPLSYAQFKDTLAHTKYYLTAGVRDIEMPANFTNVCNYGACLVVYGMSLEKYGFVNGETYIRIDSLEEIPNILHSDKWRTVGPAGQAFVRKEFTVTRTASKIFSYYKK